jgi:hypothetical protein
MYFIGYGRGNLAGPASFRTARGTQFIPAFFLLAGFPFLPRSPRWLAKVGREKEVIETLANIQAAGNTEDPLVIAEWGEIVTVMRAEEEAGPGWRKFFRDGMWMRTMAGMSVQAWQVCLHPLTISAISSQNGEMKLTVYKQQLAGANVIVYYLTYIAGLRGNAAMVTSGVQYAVFIIFTGVMWIFTDRTFRRGLLILGAIGMGFCHFVVVGTMGMHSVQVPDGVDGNLNIIFKVNPSAPANTVIVFSYLLIVVYALTLAPVCWIYAAEVWSLGTRATGMSMAAMSNWVFNFALGVFTPPAFINIEWKPFIIFGALCLTAVAWFFVFFPETCGKTLEEVELMFSKNDPKPWNTRKGESRLEAGIEAVIARKLGGND